MTTLAIRLACLSIGLSASAAFAQAGATPGPAATAEPAAEWFASPRPSLRVSRQMPPSDALAPGQAVPLPTRGGEGERAEASSITAWTIELKDRTLHETLRRWSEQAGWQLVWEADRDFAIDAEFSLRTDFVAALDTVMRSLAATDYPLQAIVNPQTRVVRIVRYMDGARR